MARRKQVERSRALLIEAAAEALVAGNGNFELQEVARLAGVSVGLPYHRFGSKAGLVAAVVEHFYDQLQEVIVLADVDEKDWALREQIRLSRLVEFLYANELAAVIISTLARDPEVAAVEAERWNGLIELTARNIVKGQARGQLPAGYQPAVLGALICGGVRHAAGLALAATPRPSRSALTRQIWNFIASGLQLDRQLLVQAPSRRSGR